MVLGHMNPTKHAALYQTLPITLRSERAAATQTVLPFLGSLNRIDAYALASFGAAVCWLYLSRLPSRSAATESLPVSSHRSSQSHLDEQTIGSRVRIVIDNLRGIHNQRDEDESIVATTERERERERPEGNLFVDEGERFDERIMLLTRALADKDVELDARQRTYEEEVAAQLKMMRCLEAGALRDVTLLRTAAEQRSDDLRHIQTLHLLHEESSQEAQSLRSKVSQLHKVRRQKSIAPP